MKTIELLSLLLHLMQLNLVYCEPTAECQCKDEISRFASIQQQNEERIAQNEARIMQLEKLLLARSSGEDDHAVGEGEAVSECNYWENQTYADLKIYETEKRRHCVQFPNLVEKVENIENQLLPQSESALKSHIDNSLSKMDMKIKVVEKKMFKLFSPLLDVNKEDEHRFTPLMLAAKEGREDDVETLLKVTGIDINKGKAGNYQSAMTALHFAASAGHEGVIRLLLAAPGIDVNVMGSGGWTPLYHAAYNGQEGAVRLLLAAPGIDVNKDNLNEWTPLHTAAYRGNMAVVKILLADSRVVTNIRNAGGKTALDYAILMDHWDIAAVLKKHS